MVSVKVSHLTRFVYAGFGLVTAFCLTCCGGAKKPMEISYFVVGEDDIVFRQIPPDGVLGLLGPDALLPVDQQLYVLPCECEWGSELHFDERASAVLLMAQYLARVHGASIEWRPRAGGFQAWAKAKGKEYSLSDWALRWHARADNALRSIVERGLGLPVPDYLNRDVDPGTGDSGSGPTKR